MEHLTELECLFLELLRELTDEQRQDILTIMRAFRRVVE